MASSTTMTVRLDREIEERLRRLAAETRRSRSYLAAEAVAAYVDRELEIIDGIRSGLADVAAGRVVSHEQVIAEVGKVISEAKANKARRR